MYLITMYEWMNKWSDRIWSHRYRERGWEYSTIKWKGILLFETAGKKQEEGYYKWNKGISKP